MSKDVEGKCWIEAMIAPAVHVEIAWPRLSVFGLLAPDLPRIIADLC
jgi:hypothetical protein